MRQRIPADGTSRGFTPYANRAPSKRCKSPTMPDLTAPRGTLARRLLALLAVLASGLDPGLICALRGVWRLWRDAVPCALLSLSRAMTGGVGVAPACLGRTTSKSRACAPSPCPYVCRDAFVSWSHPAIDARRSTAHGRRCAALSRPGGRARVSGHGSAWPARLRGAWRLAPLCPTCPIRPGSSGWRAAGGSAARVGGGKVRGCAGVCAHV